MVNVNTKTKKILLYVIVGVFGTASMFSATFASRFDTIQANWGDTIFNAYVLEHVYKSFFDPGYSADLLNPQFFYPQPNVFLLSDNLLGSAPIYWIYRSFFDWSLAFQFWGITVIVFTYICTLLLFEDLDIFYPVGALSAYVFAFGMPRVAQLWHPQLYPQFYTPIALLFLFRFLKKSAIKNFNLFILFVYLQLLAGYYLGWFLVFALFIGFFIWGGFFPDGLRDKVYFILQEKKKVLLSLSGWAVLFGVTWVPYILAGSKYKHLHALDYIVPNLGGIGSWFLAPAGSIYGSISKQLFMLDKATQEQMVFSGFYLAVLLTLLVGFLIAPVIRDRMLKKTFLATFRNTYSDPDISNLVRTLVATGIIVSLLVLNISGFSMWSFIYVLVPGTEGIRYVSRIWVVSYLFFLIGGSILASEILKGYSWNRKTSLLLACAFVFFIAEQVVWVKSSYSKNEFKSMVADMKTVFTSNVSCDSYYVKINIPKGLPKEEADKIFIDNTLVPMWAGMETNKPVLNGYTAFLLYNFMDNFNEDKIREVVNRPGETVCVLDREQNKAFSLSRIKL